MAGRSEQGPRGNPNGAPLGGGVKNGFGKGDTQDDGRLSPHSEVSSLHTPALPALGLQDLGLFSQVCLVITAVFDLILQHSHPPQLPKHLGKGTGISN